MDSSMPGLLEFTQTHVHRVGDAIQPSHPLVPFSSRLKSYTKNSLVIKNMGPGARSPGFDPGSAT